jgi:PKD repeat protein
VAAYNFDQLNGTVLTDVSGNGNNGTISNANWSTAGKFGGALSFSGNANSLVTVANSASLGLTTGMTLEAWVDPKSFTTATGTGWSAVIAKENRASFFNDIDYALYGDTGSSTAPATSILSGTASSAVSASSALSLSNWTFLAATYDGSVLRMYVNGTLKGSVSFGHITPTTDPLRIGGTWSGDMFNGLIDNVRIYNTALSTSAIQSDMTTPVSGALTAAVTAPSAGALVMNTVSLTATASGSIGVTGVQFYVDSLPVGSVDTTVPYKYSWDSTTVANGTHLVTATATDLAGNTVTSASVGINVANALPKVKSVSPARGATTVAVTSSVSATFTKAMNSTTVNGQTVELFAPNSVPVAATVSYNTSTHAATLTPTAPLAYSTSYTVVVVGGSSGVKDLAGNAMSVNYTWSFTTVAQAGAPVANAGSGPGGNEGTAEQFSGSVTGGQAPLTYKWIFGDGASASGTLTPSHTYADAGSYTATLTVTDSLGHSSSSSTIATVSEVTPTAHAGGPYSGSAGSPINLTGSATDAPTDLAGMTYAWTFGDGATSSTQNPSHAYTAAGTYTVTLTVTNPDGLTASVSSTATISSTSSQPFPDNSNPSPLPPPSGAVINVSTVSQLQSAVTNLQSGQTIMVAPGTYQVTGTLYFPQNLTNIAIRGADGKAGDVIIQGDAVLDPTAPYNGSAIWGAGSGISGSMPFGIWLGNVQGVTIGDLTIEDFVDSDIMLNAGVQSPLVHDVVMLDSGEQLLKSNPDGNGGGVNNGVVEYCTIGYSIAAPNNYTNGIDLHTTQNWVIRNNVFENISTTNTITTTNGGALAGPAILVWNHSSNAAVLDNTFINDQREVAFGLVTTSTGTDNSGGIIANNMIYRSGGQHGDVSIGVWNSPNTEVAYNTVILNGDYVNAVEYRFATTTGVNILNNLTDAAITQRDGASATVTGNVTSGAQTSWFVNEAVGDLHLTSKASGAIGKGTYLSAVPYDYDGQPRPSSGAPSVGADQYFASPLLPSVSSVTPANGATNVVLNTNVIVAFNEALDPRTVTTSTVQLLDPSGNLVAATVFYNGTTYTATLTPNSPLAQDTTYKVLVLGGSTGSVIKDPEGDATSANFSSTFTSDAPSSPPSANAGPNESGPEGTAVTFSGSVQGGQAPLAYTWNFGDGSTTSGTLSPSHVYNEPGTYTATLTVRDSASNSSSSSVTATIGEVTPAANAGGSYSGTPGSAINFSGSATDSPADVAAGISYAWTFGDGGTSTVQNPSHSYAAAGSFTATLTITNADSLSASSSATVTVSASGGSEPLLHSSDLQYVGAFRVPAVLDTLGSGDYTYSYGGTALAYNPTDNGLFIVGMPYDQAISEISIPQSIVNSTNLDNLATADVLQAPVPVLNELPNNPPISGNSGGMDIGGLLVNGNQLLGTAYAYYDSDGQAVYSHFVMSSLNLATAKAGGLYQVGNQGAGLVAGYMTPIPTEWQAALGAPDLTGQADINIIGRTSSGPGAFGFDPSKLGSSAAPAIPYAYYPVNNPLGPYEGPANPLQSGTAKVNGTVFVPGSSSVLFFGSTGTNYEGYGLPSDYGDNVNSDKGPHSLNGEYALQVWAYNANDYVKAKQGTLQPWQVQPYDVWNFTVPNATTTVGGVAYDAKSGRLYLSLVEADNEQPYTDLPLIEVFQVNVPSGSSGQVAPQIGTLAATSLAPAPSSSTSPYLPGPVPSGANLLLTAGNVFAINSGDSIAQVAFYLAPGTGSSFSSNDLLLGYGAGAQNLPNGGSSNWTLSKSTSGLAKGTYTVFAQAKDADGLFSDPIATTFTIS